MLQTNFPHGFALTITSDVVVKKKRKKNSLQTKQDMLSVTDEEKREIKEKKQTNQFQKRQTQQK